MSDDPISRSNRMTAIAGLCMFLAVGAFFTSPLWLDQKPVDGCSNVGLSVDYALEDSATGEVIASGSLDVVPGGETRVTVPLGTPHSSGAQPELNLEVGGNAVELTYQASRTSLGADQEFVVDGESTTLPSIEIQNAPKGYLETGDTPRSKDSVWFGTEVLQIGAAITSHACGGAVNKDKE